MKAQKVSIRTIYLLFTKVHSQWSTSRSNTAAATAQGTIEKRNVRAGRHPWSWVFILSIAILVLGTDLVSKFLAFQYVAGVPVQITREYHQAPPHHAINLVPNGLSLKLVVNEGAIFGLGQGRQQFFIGVSIVAVLVLGRMFWISPARAYGTHLALALILAGAVGNLYDRIRFGGVRDMLYLFPGVKLPFGWHWPGQPLKNDLYPWIFNVADAALVLGVSIMLILMWRGKTRSSDQ